MEKSIRVLFLSFGLKIEIRFVGYGERISEGGNGERRGFVADWGLQGRTKRGEREE